MKASKSPLIVLSALIACLPLAVSAEKANPPATFEAAPDFGDSSSAVLTTKAWNALTAKNQKSAQLFTNKCIEIYKAQAVEMQKTLKEPTTVKEETEKLWALNDVGTCYFILGQSLEAEGKPKEALVAYNFLIEKLPFAQCWDMQGWYWKPADAAREKAKSMAFDALD